MRRTAIPASDICTVGSVDSTRRRRGRVVMSPITLADIPVNRLCSVDTPQVTSRERESGRPCPLRRTPGTWPGQFGLRFD